MPSANNSHGSTALKEKRNVHFCQRDFTVFKFTALVTIGKCYKDFKTIFIFMCIVGKSNNEQYLKHARDVLLGVAYKHATRSSEILIWAIHFPS